MCAFAEYAITILCIFNKMQEDKFEMQVDYSFLEKTINKIFLQILCNLSFYRLNWAKSGIRP